MDACARGCAYKKDDNRIVRPFAWGAEFISEHVNGDDPRAIFSDHTRRVMAHSDEFFALPEITTGSSWATT